MQRKRLSVDIPWPTLAFNWRHWLPTPGNMLFTLLIAILLITSRPLWAAQTSMMPGASATTVNYQGRLADNNGNPLSGTFPMAFAIYNAPTGGNVLWGPEVHASVTINQGLFSVGLGSLTSGGIPTTVWDGDRYLQITVNGDVLSPRELIRSVPIAGMALNALNAVDADSSAFAKTVVGTGSVTTTSPTYVPLPGMSLTIELEETRHVVTMFSGGVTNTSHTGPSVVFRLLIDGVVKAQAGPQIGQPSSSEPIAIHWGETLPPGTHHVEIQWSTSVGTARMVAQQQGDRWEQRVLSIMAFDE